MKARIRAEMESARARQLALLAIVPASDQERQVSPIMSPLCWDVAHIAHYEELWLLRELDAADFTEERFDDVYDAFKHPRAERPGLDLLDADRARAYAADVRKRTLDVLADVDLDGTSPLTANGFVYGMVIQHEHQHIETMLATLQLMEHPPLRGVRPAAGPSRATLPEETGIDGGVGVSGASSYPWAYDNERPAHEVRLKPFFIDTTPVTNGEYVAFVEAGGYHDAACWSDDGLAWRAETGAEHPEFWSTDGTGWTRRRFGLHEPLPPHEPVQHVSWYEADAYARWRGKRLPTEAEWERAATVGAERRFPWGEQEPTPERAALASTIEHFGPTAVGMHPSGASAAGVHDLVGGVWEWTSSDFGPYPGFEAFPYREYSEVFFDDRYKVLRGGSWATHPSVARTTFRNWDLPVRRQIFAGFRCARDGS